MPEDGPVDRDYFPPELVRLTVTAIAVLDTHVRSDRCCAACGQVWPCQPACLADHNLAGL
jgi:hypothetical protein